MLIKIVFGIVVIVLLTLFLQGVVQGFIIAIEIGGPIGLIVYTLMLVALVIFCKYLVKREKQKEKREQEIKDNTKLTKQTINFEKIKANLILNNYNGDLYNNLYNYIYCEFSYIIKYRTDVRRKIEDYYESTDTELYWRKGIYPDVGKIFGYILEQEEFLTEENKKLFFENYPLFSKNLSKYIYEKFVKDFVEEIELDYSEREDYWSEEERRKRGIE